MFSDRFEWNTSPNALSIMLQEMKARGETIFDLTQSNPTQAGLIYDTDSILSALSQTDAMVYEPDPRGLLKARRAIARYYQELGEQIENDAIFLTASTSEAYSMIFKLLGNSKDEILVPCPGYPLIPYLAHFENLQAVSYPLRYTDADGWSIDMNILEALISPRTKAIVVVNPNNPTGNFLKPHEREALDKIGCDNGLALIVDEVFSGYHGPGIKQEASTVVNRTHALTFVLNGFSKMLGLPQVKLAWMVIGGDSGYVEDAQYRMEMLLDFYLSVGTPVQHAASSLFGLRKEIRRQISDRVNDNYQFLKERSESSSHCRVLTREGGWYGIIEFFNGISDEDRLLQLLEHDRILVHPGFFYEFEKEGIVVVSLLTPIETFRTGISRLIS